MSQAYDDMSREYDGIFSNGMQYDRQFLRDLANTRNEAAEQLDDTANRVVGSIVSRVRNQGSRGELKGKTLQSIDRMARRAQESGDADRVAVGAQVRDAIRANIERNAPAGVRN